MNRLTAVVFFVACFTIPQAFSYSQSSDESVSHKVGSIIKRWYKPSDNGLPLAFEFAKPAQNVIVRWKSPPRGTIFELRKAIHPSIDEGMLLDGIQINPQRPRG